MMDFDAYLKDKKIDPKKFKSGAAAQYHEFEVLFNQVHPNSFTQQKLFLINKIRRSYLLKASPISTKPSSKIIRPKVKPLKPKTN